MTFSRHPFWAAFVVLYGLVLMPATPNASEKPAEDIIARFGGTEVHGSDLEDFIRSLSPTLRKQALSDTELMNRLVGLELARIGVLNEAAARKWQNRPEVARQIRRAGENTLFTTYMATVAALPAGYPSEKEVEAAYDLNRESFLRPRQYRLEQIFVARPKNADPKAAAAASKNAAEIAQMAKARIVDFATLARAKSEHKPSAERGGDLGWAAQTQIVSEIRDQVAGMNLGDISDPIATSAGWHIIRLVGTKPAGPAPLGEVKEELASALRDQKLKENEEAYVARLLERSPVSVDGARLRELFKAAP